MPPSQRCQALTGYVDSAAATLGMQRRWVAKSRPLLGFAAATVKCVGYRLELLVGFGQCQQFE